MLSILIPTYHYNAFPLAVELERQALKTNIAFELICVDDGSFSDLNIENQKINNLSNCKFIEAKKNIGRTASRLFLAKQAQYNWLLFIDADVLPKNSNFLSKYLKEIKGNHEAIFGGFAYQEASYAKNKTLRFTFGKQREEVDAAIRNQNPYKVIISANVLIKKSIYQELIKNNTDNSYGMDYLLGALLKKRQIKIWHINNEVYHFGLDENSEFLKKTEGAMLTLKNLHESKQVTNNDISLLKAYGFLKLFYLQHLFGKVMLMFDLKIKTNLTQENPNLLLFDLYRLGYFCRIHN
ncbi:glycosyltransferase family 2 protein [Xanthomarina sp. F2636L]|uniref:glycosyltransferase family 2 protein n=1 Tax=Xanthomarina sp. F2636L TaxID=2996018 RepID=UPI00225E313D|nr:glycosyltransferase [Xanthomarina sp. F2636L]MCX7550556.1 glycosyltransferase [Xanthomarina sp. F2636L]